ncbi:MAG: carboxypeptidase regulatory-like domain-containing protein [Chitinophagaceae bacterium]|nr:carboxypeptidase regulatory-like domain-containing protein [Chitinophagaceae bacterium]
MRADKPIISHHNNTMANKEITPKDFAKNFNDVLKAFDGDRELEFYKEILNIRQEQLERQKEFLTAKYSKDDERVSVITARMSREKKALEGIQTGLTFASFNTMEVADKSCQIHGFVYDKGGQIIAGRRVILINAESGEPLKNVLPAISGDNGHYSITINEEQIKLLQDLKIALALVVMDRGNVVIEERLKLTHGRIIYLDIKAE